MKIHEDLLTSPSVLPLTGGMWYIHTTECYSAFILFFFNSCIYLSNVYTQHGSLTRDSEIELHALPGAPYSTLKEKGTLPICDNMDEAGGHDTK